METLLKSNPARIYASKEINMTHLETSFWTKLESNRFAVIPILLVIIGCMGGLAASFGAGSSILKLALVAFPTSIATSLIIGLAPMRLVSYVSILAVVVDLIYLFL